MPFVYEIAEACLRALLFVLLGYLSAHKIISDELAHKASEGWARELAGPLVGIVITLAWTLWRYYQKRLVMLTALVTQPGATEADVKQAVAFGISPSVLTNQDKVPTLSKK